MDQDFSDLEAALEAAFGAFETVGAYGDFTPPTSANDALSYTIGDYLDLLDLAEAAITSVDTSVFSTFLNNPGVREALEPEDIAYFEAWMRGDFSTILAPFAEARAALAGLSRDTILSDAFTTGLPTGEYSAEVRAAFAEAETRITEFLWGEQDGLFSSPLFSVDALTGNWFAQNGTDQGAYSGNTLAELYQQIGEAASNAIISFLGSDDNSAAAAFEQSINAASIAQAQAASQAAAAEAFAALQTLANQAFQDASIDATAAETLAAAQIQGIYDALADILTDDTSILNKFTLGSRNSDPSFVVSLDGIVNGSAEGDWFFLSREDNIFNGGVGADLLFGLDGDDWLLGGADADELFGGVGDDILNGGVGDDGINGGDGDGDLAVFASAMSQATLQIARDGSVTVTDRAGNEGTDVLTGIEALSFSSGATIFDSGFLDLSIVQGITTLSEADIDTFIELYIAYFNRAPDALGLYFWGSAFANGTALEDIATLFLDQDETRATYPSDSTTLDFVTQVYSNVLGRIPDADGLAFWQGQLDEGNIARGNFILEVLRGVKADAEPGTSQEDMDLRLGDRGFLADKTDIGAYFSVINGLSNVDDAAQAMELYVRGEPNSIQAAVDEIDRDFVAASAADSGELLLQLVGVADDPFAV